MAPDLYTPDIEGGASQPAGRDGTPRLFVGGLSGDAGKTLVSLGLLLALRQRGIEVRAFKKGPDYIDAAWLRWASGHPARNIDTWLAGFEAARATFCRHAIRGGLNLVEGNRGLFDGVDSVGTHSTAELAKALNAPVLLVVDARKATRTLAACVLGCRVLDRDVDIAGVILNRVAGARHEAVARGAIETACHVPVIGSLPRFEVDALPGRHLGLVTPEEHTSPGGVDAAARAVASRVDLDAVIRIANAASGRLDAALGEVQGFSPARAGAGVKARTTADIRVGYLRDSAFSFYYPENLEALEACGAALVPVSSLDDRALPPGLGALYCGGGFPETHAARLAANRAFLDSIRRAAEGGLPIYAECGGLMLLARAIACGGRWHQMAGLLPFDVEMCERPQGHGYARLVVDRANPFFPIGTVLLGHEFHYSRAVEDAGAGGVIGGLTACAVERGSGLCGGRDAATINNVWASYTHVHATATPGWATGLVRAAERFHGRR